MTMSMNGQKRAAFGFVTTWENRDGRTLSAHRAGSVRLMLPLLIDDILRLDPSFRLVSYSTPETVLSDLNGSRSDFTHEETFLADSTSSATRLSRRIGLPEVRILGRVGRKDLLSPRLGGPGW